MQERARFSELSRRSAGGPQNKLSKLSQIGVDEDGLEKAYTTLLNSTSRVVGQAKRFAQEILDGTKHATSAAAQVALEGLKGQINEMIPRVRQVISQRERASSTATRALSERSSAYSSRQPRRATFQGASLAMLYGGSTSVSSKTSALVSAAR